MDCIQRKASNCLARLPVGKASVLWNTSTISSVTKSRDGSLTTENSDKGDLVVVMDQELCKSEDLSQLSNEHYCTTWMLLHQAFSVQNRRVEEFHANQILATKKFFHVAHLSLCVERNSPFAKHWEIMQCHQFNSLTLRVLQIWREGFHRRKVLILERYEIQKHKRQSLDTQWRHCTTGTDTICRQLIKFISWISTFSREIWTTLNPQFSMLNKISSTWSQQCPKALIFHQEYQQFCLSFITVPFTCNLYT